MGDFDPSPRSSKRRRTGTYATSRRTLASSPSISVLDSGTTTRGSTQEAQQPEDAKEPASTDFEAGEEPPSEKSPSRRNDRKKTAEDEFSDIVASAQTGGRPKRTRKSRNTVDAVVE